MPINNKKSFNLKKNNFSVKHCQYCFEVGGKTAEFSKKYYFWYKELWNCHWSEHIFIIISLHGYCRALYQKLKICCPSVKFVDDSTEYELGTLDEILDKSRQLAANEASSWSDQNYMKINTSKTKEMLIYFHKKKKQHWK